MHVDPLLSWHVSISLSFTTGVCDCSKGINKVVLCINASAEWIMPASSLIIILSPGISAIPWTNFIILRRHAEYIHFPGEANPGQHDTVTTSSIFHWYVCVATSLTNIIHCFLECVSASLQSTTSFYITAAFFFFFCQSGIWISMNVIKEIVCVSCTCVYVCVCD